MRQPCLKGARGGLDRAPRQRASIWCMLRLAAVRARVPGGPSGAGPSLRGAGLIRPVSPLDSAPPAAYHTGPLRREGGSSTRQGRESKSRRRFRMNRTYSPKLAEIEHQWFVLDATGIPLGRLSTMVARLLMGKHKPTYATHIDTGDFVIVINAEKSVLTGRKEEQKMYHHHTGYPGGIKSESAADRRRRRPSQMPGTAGRALVQ